MAKKAPNFEKTLKDLEKLVEEMEKGDLTLEDSLKSFEKGIALTTDCQKALQQAELRVKQLVEKNAQVLEEEFDLED